MKKIHEKKFLTSGNDGAIMGDTGKRMHVFRLLKFLLGIGKKCLTSARQCAILYLQAQELLNGIHREKNGGQRQLISEKFQKKSS